MVAGFLAASACPTVEDFPLSELVALAGDQALTDEQAVLDFVAASLANLRDEDMGFAPLIADDDEPLAQRVDELAEWCGSFLSGFAAANATGRDQLPVDIQEIIRDFATYLQWVPMWNLRKQTPSRPKTRSPLVKYTNMCASVCYWCSHCSMKISLMLNRTLCSDGAWSG